MARAISYGLGLAAWGHLSGNWENPESSCYLLFSWDWCAVKAKIPDRNTSRKWLGQQLGLSLTTWGKCSPNWEAPAGNILLGFSIPMGLMRGQVWCQLAALNLMLFDILSPHDQITHNNFMPINTGVEAELIGLSWFLIPVNDSWFI